jgi:hypothetical protein
MHCGTGLVPVFLRRRKETGHALRHWIGPRLPQGATIASAANRPWDVERSKLEHRPRESGISHAQALPGDQNRFAINGLRLRTASDHRETAGVAMHVLTACNACPNRLDAAVLNERRERSAFAKTE